MEGELSGQVEPSGDDAHHSCCTLAYTLPSCSEGSPRRQNTVSWHPLGQKPLGVPQTPSVAHFPPTASRLQRAS